MVTLKRVGELKVHERGNEVKVMSRSQHESRKPINILDRIDCFAFTMYFFSMVSTIISSNIDSDAGW